MPPSVKQRQFCCVSYQIKRRFIWNKNGDSKMVRRDQELLDKQMRRLTPPRNDGAIAVMLATMFLVGIAIGSVLSAHESKPIQIASMEGG